MTSRAYEMAFCCPHDRINAENYRPSNFVFFGGCPTQSPAVHRRPTHCCAGPARGNAPRAHAGSKSRHVSFPPRSLLLPNRARSPRAYGAARPPKFLASHGSFQKFTRRSVIDRFLRKWVGAMRADLCGNSTCWVQSCNVCPVLGSPVIVRVGTG